MNRRWLLWIGAVSVALAFFGWVGGSRGKAAAAAPAAPAASLLVDGDFEKDQTGKQLRAKETPQGWYESRHDGAKGRKRLVLSMKPVAGNATKKALIRGSSKLNTYLSQAFSQPQTGRFTLQWDILVKSIRATPNRSVFQLIGDDSVKGKGPNATGTERFVFLGCENAATKGKMNLFAFAGGAPDPLAKRIPVAANLDLGKWYTVRVNVDVPGKSYVVTFPGTGAAPVVLRAFEGKGQPAPKKLTHISFASWNDGPGTFYVDNVKVP
jgi:hypothetical protein